MIRRASVPLALVVAAACRIGGPSGDPSAYLQFGDAADGPSTQDAPDAASDASYGPDSSIGALDALDAPSSEASAATDATDAGSDGGAPTVCAPAPSIPVCDPVHDTGCFLLQCDVDMIQSTPTGQCVGGGLASAGAPCTPVSGSEICQARSTCFGGMCRRLCFCDSDCAGGQCCTDTAGTSGFHLCAPCH
jgi:hypothetical protein